MSKNFPNKILLNLSLVFLIILLIHKTYDFLFPIYQVFMFLLTTGILSIYIFYAFRPLRIKLSQWTKRPTLSSVLTFVVFLVILVTLFSVTLNIILSQSVIFLQNLDLQKILDLGQSGFLKRLQDFLPLEDLAQKLQGWLQGFATRLPGEITGFLGNLGSFASLVLLIILGFFYALKDEDLIVERIRSIEFGRHHHIVMEVLAKIHKTLKTYISGQILVAFILGALIFTGYMIVGLDYALSLALIAMMMNFIPFIGPFLGAVPAVLVALTISPAMVLKVVIVTVIAQQAEGNLITPNIMGNKLDVHPFIIILAVLVCIQLFGILGALIASPLYMVIKILIQGLKKAYREEKKSRTQADKS